MSSHPGEGSGAPLPHLEEYIYIYITPVRGERVILRLWWRTCLVVWGGDTFGTRVLVNVGVIIGRGISPDDRKV